jgi:hypothetical protein
MKKTPLFYRKQMLSVTIHPGTPFVNPPKEKKSKKTAATPFRAAAA